MKPRQAKEPHTFYQLNTEPSEPDTQSDLFFSKQQSNFRNTRNIPLDQRQMKQDPCFQTPTKHVPTQKNKLLVGKQMFTKSSNFATMAINNHMPGSP